MRLRNAAIAVLVPVIALGLAACGGSGKAAKAEKAQEQLAAQHWRAGLRRWHRTTQHALDGISVIFSTEASLVDLRRKSSKTSASLVSYDRVLTGCSRTVRRLGPVPPGLEVAGHYALEACSSLEEGEQGVEVLVQKLRHSYGIDTLDPVTGAGGLLSEGQSDLLIVVHVLNDAPD